MFTYCIMNNLPPAPRWLIDEIDLDYRPTGHDAICPQKNSRRRSQLFDFARQNSTARKLLDVCTHQHSSQCGRFVFNKN
jgi:hypothetical protein